MIKSCAQETGIEPPKLQPTLPSSETIDFTVIFNKNKYDVQFPLDDNIGQLKKHLEDVIGVWVFFLYLNLIYNFVVNAFLYNFVDLHACTAQIAMYAILKVHQQLL